MRSMLQASVHPLFDNFEIDDLLQDARRADADGRAPVDADWVGTYDLNSAAVQGWEMKAGKTAHQYYWSASGQQFNPQQYHEHCLTMAEQYRRKIIVSVPVSSRSYASDAGRR